MMLNDYRDDRSREACTSACTNNAENAHETPVDAQGGSQSEGTAQANAGVPGDLMPLEVLAKAIADLSADDRARLTAMLTGGKGGNQ